MGYGGTDRPSYRDARTHLKMLVPKSHHYSFRSVIGWILNNLLVSDISHFVRREA